MFRPIKSEKIYMTVIRQVKRLIEDGQLSPGDRLPAERKLACTLSVSRASVRQAISALEAQGLVQIRHGDGTYVTDVTERRVGDDVIESFSRVLVAEQITPQEIIETRRIVECVAARLCAQRAGADHVRKLESLLERGRLASGDKASLDRMNCDLHLAVAEGGGNRGLIKVMEVVVEMMRLNMWSPLKQLSEARGRRLEGHLDQHERIVDAIKRHDGDGAFGSMQAHLDAIQAEMREDLDAPVG